MLKCTVWRDVLGERAQVKIFSPSSSSTPIFTQIYFILEHGWRTAWKDDAVYLSEDLLAYYAGNGTVLDIHEDGMYITGKPEIITDEFSTATVVWPFDPPEIVDGKHKTLNPWPEDYPDEYKPIHWPHTATGRLRLMAQCFSAAHRSLSSLISAAGWLIYPDRPALYPFGVIESPDGELWLVQINVFNCRLVKLVGIERYKSAIEYIKTTDWPTEMDENLAMSYAISVLDVEREEESNAVVVHEIATEEDLATVYYSGARPVAHNWHWHPVESKAAVVMAYSKDVQYGDEDYTEVAAHSFVARAEVIWSEIGDTGVYIPDSLDLSVDVGNDISIYRPFHKAWWYEPISQQWFTLHSDVIDVDNNWLDKFSGKAPVYCFWSSSGDEWILSTLEYDAAEKDLLLGSNPFSSTEPSNCTGTSNYSEYTFTSFTGSISAGGFSIEDKVAAPDTAFLGGYVDETREWELSANKSGFFDLTSRIWPISGLGTAILWANSDSGPECGSSATADFFASATLPAAGELRIQYNGATLDIATSTRYSTGTASRFQSLFITPDPAVIYLVDRKAPSVGVLRVTNYTQATTMSYVIEQMQGYIIDKTVTPWVYTYGPIEQARNQWNSVGILGYDPVVGATKTIRVQAIGYNTTTFGGGTTDPYNDEGYSKTHIVTPFEVITNEDGGFYDWACSDKDPATGPIECWLFPYLSHFGELMAQPSPREGYLWGDSEFTLTEVGLADKWVGCV